MEAFQTKQQEKILGVNPKFYGRLRSASIEYVNRCFEGVMCI